MTIGAEMETARETPPSSAAAGGGAGPAVRRAHRSVADRYIGGVAGGLAEHLGVSQIWVRAGFLVASAFGGFGLALYAGLWMVLPLQTPTEEDAPGLASADRQGKRRTGRRSLHDIGPLVALSAVALGLMLLTQTLFGVQSLNFWPLVLAGAGIALLWWQADEAQRERWTDRSSRLNPLSAVLGKGTWASVTRLLVGAALIIGALALFAVQSGRLADLNVILVAGVLGVGGLALILGPWLFRLSSDLSEERAARIRTEERADIAAHLHDSVLQTLALIQKHADDGRTVATLARAQERDLRSWLYGDQAAHAATLGGALRSAAAEVEDAHGLPVEVVTVGDAAYAEQLSPLVLATREAVVNAAKHSGADRVDVYAEIGAAEAEVFVRDRGRGFDPDTVPADRMGVRGSIIDRMERHGGRCTIRTAPGEGTEVRLAMPIPATEEQQ